MTPGEFYDKAAGLLPAGTRLAVSLTLIASAVPGRSWHATAHVFRDEDGASIYTTADTPIEAAERALERLRRGDWTHRAPALAVGL